MLDAIYNGDYQGVDIVPPDSKEFHEAMMEYEKIVQKFKDRLNQEELDFLDELLCSRNRLQAEESREYYMQGFSAGAMLMMDVFRQYQRFSR